MSVRTGPLSTPVANTDHQRAGRELVLAARRVRRRQRAQVGLVWLALFAILGVLLYLLRIDVPYMLAHQGFVVQGLVTTLWVSLLSISLATILAFIGALGRLAEARKTIESALAVGVRDPRILSHAEEITRRTRRAASTNSRPAR